ncbi:MAG: hypothetical protein ACK5MY_13800 [Jhaorihella sp.]
MTDTIAPSGGAANTSGVIRSPIADRDLGHATITPDGAHQAGTWASFTLTYTAGTFGIDDSGSLRVCFRFASDQSNPQFDDPKGAGFTIVEASNGAVLQTRFDPKGNVRPWDRTLWIKVVKGFLSEGDTITIRFGVTDHGGPGMRLQTFCEDSFEFRVLVDPIATFNFQTLPVQPTIAIVSGPPDRYVAVLPTRCKPGARFSLKIKGEDAWGNPSDRCDTRLWLHADRPIEGLPETVALKPGDFAARIDGLSVADEGFVTVELRDEAGGVVAVANPLQINSDEVQHFWGDLHGQSEETIGTGSARDYFAFARDRAFVDACGHQGNDFQITDAFWAELNRLSSEFDEAGSYVVLPGYEWSGNTALGGDRNVFYRDETRAIRRSSRALIEDESHPETDCPTAHDLFAAFEAAGEFDTVCFAHCGGRYADIGYAHDGRFERSIEVHSSWGSFEWLLHDAFRLGYRVGVVANSDGHKGRPGASYPGAGKFGAIGGLTCYLMPRLDRATLLDCLRKRHHYGTTGGPTGRMIIDLVVRFDAEGTLYHDDPALGPAAGRPAREAMMGDIVHLPKGGVTLDFSVSAAAPIERVELFDGETLLETYRPYAQADLGKRIRVMWEGAEYRGRFRQVSWDGTATLDGATLVDAAPVNFLNRDKILRCDGDDRLSWEALTTGNQGGIDLWLANAAAGRLSLKTPLIDAEVDIADIGLQDTVFDNSAELPRFLRLYRLPDVNPHNSLSATCHLTPTERGDSAIYLRVTLEDGTRAWTSPTYVTRSL